MPEGKWSGRQLDFAFDQEKTTKQDFTYAGTKYWLHLTVRWKQGGGYNTSQAEGFLSRDEGGTDYVTSDEFTVTLEEPFVTRGEVGCATSVKRNVDPVATAQSRNPDSPLVEINGLEP